MRMETEKVRDYLKRADLYTYMGRIDKIVGTRWKPQGRNAVSVMYVR